MKFYRNLNIKQRIQLVAFTLLMLLFLVSAYVVFSFSVKRTINTTHQHMAVYLNRLADIMELVEQHSGTGFDSKDYSSLKPIFNSSTFYTSDYPFLIDNSGTFLIHLFKEKQKLSREHFQQIVSAPQGQGYFKYNYLKNGIEQASFFYFKRISTNNSFVCITLDEDELLSQLSANRVILLIIVIIGTIAYAFSLSFVTNPMVKTIKKLNSNISLLAKGEIPEQIGYQYLDEIGEINRSINSLIDGMERTSEFAEHIGNNNLDADFAPLGPKDKLGNALLNTRKRLKEASIEEDKRKVEDNRRNWLTSGLATFGDILRQNNNNLQILSDNVLKNLIDYLNANQGGLFTYNDDDNENIHLELVSAFAYNRKKYMHKTIMLGEGLVGNCAIEKQTIHLREIPSGYIELTSGLGEANPRSLIIVPLKLENKIFGVLELASFNEFETHEIEFIEKIGESIASTLSAVRNNIRTNYLLEQSQQQREEMAAQEEEMRQNMEEMLATQEEMARKTIEVEGMTAAINESLLFAEISEEGLISTANINFIQLSGYSKTELESKTLGDIIHPDDYSLFYSAWGEILDGAPYKGTLRWKTSTGNEAFVLTNISPSFDEAGSLYKLYFLGQDVTESKLLEQRAQKQAEEIEQALLEIQVEQDISKVREEEMDSLMQALDQTCLITQLNTDGIITYINQKNVETLGDSKEAIEGKALAEIDFQARQNPEEYQSFWNKLILGEHQQREFSLMVKNKLVWIMEHFVPVHNSEGDIVKVIIIGIDISGFKAKEKELQQQIAELKKTNKK
jgi:PAS domain S-box-containing protein